MHDSSWRDPPVSGSAVAWWAFLLNLFLIVLLWIEFVDGTLMLVLPLDTDYDVVMSMVVFSVFALINVAGILHCSGVAIPFWTRWAALCLCLIVFAFFLRLVPPSSGRFGSSSARPEANFRNVVVVALMISTVPVTMRALRSRYLFAPPIWLKLAWFVVMTVWVITRANPALFIGDMPQRSGKNALIDLGDYASYLDSQATLRRTFDVIYWAAWVIAVLGGLVRAALHRDDVEAEAEATDAKAK
jgi:hypothetical protein